MLRRAVGCRRRSSWVQYGGRIESLDAELQLGLYELQNGVGEGMWVERENVRRAIGMGEVMEQYARAALAPPERCRLWERFRGDIERTIKTVMNDDGAKILMMGGVAQGMATVDGDVDLTIFLPKHMEKLQTDRSYVRTTLHIIGRALKKQGFDGFVVPARVPIIQYRPDPSIEQLFTMKGADSTFRFLTFRENPSSPSAARSVAESLRASLGVPVTLHTSPLHGYILEFPQAADAFSAMFRMGRSFTMPHLRPYDAGNFAKKDAVIKAAFDAVADTSHSDQHDTKKDHAKKKPPQGIVTIDDILKTAAEGRSTSSGVYTPYPFSVDISVAITEHPWGPRNSELLRRYLSADPRVRTLAMFVKWWSKHSLPVAINNSRSGWLTSYCVLVMLIHFLIREGRLEFIDPQQINPVLEPDTRYPDNTFLTEDDKVQVVRDFVKFCEYYATGFDYEKEVITLVTNRRKSREECTAKVMSARNTNLIIEDPYEDRSLGHPIDSGMLVKIRATFLAGARSAISNITGNCPSTSLLPVLKKSGHMILKTHYDFARGAEKSCVVCRAEEAEKDAADGVCKECSSALSEAKTPIEFFALRTGSYSKVEREVHIAEQKRQERALREQQFLSRNHKAKRIR